MKPRKCFVSSGWNKFCKPNCFFVDERAGLPACPWSKRWILNCAEYNILTFGRFNCKYEVNAIFCFYCYKVNISDYWFTCWIFLSNLFNTSTFMFKQFFLFFKLVSNAQTFLRLQIFLLSLCVKCQFQSRLCWLIFFLVWPHHLSKSSSNRPKQFCPLKLTI